MGVEINVDAIPIEKTLEIIRKFGKQLPFATSKAINETAFIVQDKEVINIQEKFTTRTKWFKKRTRFGVNVKTSNKRNLIATIFSRAPWLKKQEEGGIKVHPKQTPIIKKKVLLMPEKSIRKEKSRLIPKRFQPAKLLADPKKNRVFFIDTPGGGLLLQRKGKGKSAKTKVLFFAEERAKVPPILKFEETGEKVVQKTYKKNFGKALAFAIRTAKGNIREDK